MKTPKSLRHYNAHQRRVESYTRAVDRLFAELVEESATALFLFGQSAEAITHPSYLRLAERLRQDFARRLTVGIASAVRSEWAHSDKATDRLIRSALARLPKSRVDQYLGGNAGAVEAFVARKVKGLSLSDRVWALSEQASHEIATALELGLRDGLSAQELSRAVRKHLRDPKALFRRVRDEGGTLHPSKPMSAYRRGSGVYKSAYRNAMRLTRTETNMAYRTAEQERWQQLDFVVGYEVKRSGTGYPCDLCDSLKGKYPKSFRWATWHPNCRCYAIPILKTEDELFDAPDAPSVNEVTELPQGFRAWLKLNQARLERASERGTAPYWIRDNKQWTRQTSTKATALSTLERAKLRHSTRTPEQVEEIKKRAWSRELERNAHSLTEAERIAITNNWIEIEKELGVKKGRMMSYEEANSGSENPKYGQSEGYRVNCQSCTIVHALRRAGFDVEAHPNINNSAFNLLEKKGITWMERFIELGGGAPNYNFSYQWMKDKGYTRTSYQRLEEYLADQLTQDGVYEVYCVWRGGSAHVFCAEKKGTYIKYFDPQTGNSDVSRYKLSMQGRSVGVIRIDNKAINPKALGLVFGKK